MRLIFINETLSFNKVEWILGVKQLFPWLIIENNAAN